MEAIFPDLPGLSGSLLLAWRRRPGSPVSTASIERVFSVIVKRAFTVQPSGSDPALGSLEPRENGPAIFEADVLGADDAVEYESDLVPFKPEADLIVLPDAAPIPLTIAVDGVLRMSQTDAPPELQGLGWEARVGTPREGDGGVFTAMTQPLPNAFENRYFNGYRRDRVEDAPVPFPGTASEIAITRDGLDPRPLYGFTLPGEAPALRHHWFIGSGKDDPSLWRSRAVPMQLDTLVVEPDSDHAYTVWRAAWPVDFDPGDGPIPLDANRRVVVTLGGA